MALFLGTYNVPTNKKLIVNGVGVTLVYSNGVVVWRYVKPTTPGTGTTPGGGHVTHPPGSKGTWQVIPFNHSNRVRITASYDRNCTPMGFAVEAKVNGQVVGLGGAYAQGSHMHGTQACAGVGTDTNSVEYFSIMRWVPTP